MLSLLTSGISIAYSCLVVATVEPLGATAACGDGIPAACRMLESYLQPCECPEPEPMEYRPCTEYDKILDRCILVRKPE